MSTRDISTQRDFPFVPGPYVGEELTISHSIGDLFIVVRGAPTTAGPGVLEDTIKLVRHTENLGVLTLSFEMSRGTDVWELDFDIPVNTSAETGKAIGYSTSPDMHGVLFYNTDKLGALIFTAPHDMDVEPCRVQWYVEQLTKIEFYNIGRCYDEEFENEEYLVTSLEAGSEELQLVDGHNTTLSYEDNTLTVSTLAGIGKGRITEEQVSPVGRPACDVPTRLTSSYVTTINGLSPQDGNIDIQPGTSMTSSRERGLIEMRDTQ